MTNRHFIRDLKTFSGLTFVLASAAITQACVAKPVSEVATGSTAVPIAQGSAHSSSTGSQLTGTVPMNRTITDQIRPQIPELIRGLADNGRDYEIDGIPVFNGSDKFLTGKIALGMSHLIAGMPDDDPRLKQALADFRTIAKLTVNDVNDSWGIYYYLVAINKLNDAGRLDAAIDRLSLAKLRVRLDWRSFVDVENYQLIDHPNNYYGVAFGIARMRAKLGWETLDGAETLYAKVLKHYTDYSDYGFADELEGDGRFDRYSVLLVAEIANHFVQTGAKVPEELRPWLRKSAEVMMQRINDQGHGFEYGRSLGPYGETSMVEVLTAAAATGLLSESEMELAYAFVSRVAEQYVTFWIDPQTQSVNLWDDGRRTDAYRGKFRILGENLSLAHQFFYTNDIWNSLGYKDRVPTSDFKAMLAKLPSHEVTWFAKGEYDRMLLTIRDGGRLISLPVINGGAGQHDHNPYYPIPFSPRMLEGVADGDAPLLTPRITLKDGSVLMPLTYFRDVKVDKQGDATTVSWTQSELNRIGKKAPIADKRMSARTTYEFSPGRIRRTDVFTLSPSVSVEAVEMELGTFSKGASSLGTTTSFAEGALRSFSTTGFSQCEANPVSSDEYHTQAGAMQTVVGCSLDGAAINDGSLTLSWELRYE